MQARIISRANPNALDVASRGPAEGATASFAAVFSDLARTEDLVAAAWERTLRRKSVDRDEAYIIGILA